MSLLNLVACTPFYLHFVLYFPVMVSLETSCLYKLPINMGYRLWWGHHGASVFGYLPSTYHTLNESWIYPSSKIKLFQTAINIDYLDIPLWLCLHMFHIILTYFKQILHNSADMERLLSWDPQTHDLFLSILDSGKFLCIAPFSFPSNPHPSMGDEFMPEIKSDWKWLSSEINSMYS